MKALRFENGELKISGVRMPDEPSEALVRVTRSGICNTDLEIVRGYAGFQGTIGHEFVGIVEASPGRRELEGKRVVGEINVGCGKCELCSAGDSRHCAARTVLGIHGRDGAHAEFLTLPARNLIEVPEEVSDEEAVFVEPLAAAISIAEQVEIGPDTKVAIIGDGKLGLLCAMALSLQSENLVLIGKHTPKLSIARRCGIEAIMTAEAAKMHRRFDVAVEASGSESGFAAALDVVRPRGKIVLKSTFQGRPKWEAWRVVVDEITIIGSRCGLFAPAIELLASKRIRVGGLISDEFALKDGVAAVSRASENGVLKVTLRMQD
ncbi:MAG TPA: alcohol dehydrogenase catalytic domain-containing protein [Pyrinomonadaceae bacterium]|nr:alcohol dehydrogenase catalytic domain-containing protein [Pyrinomonadaceae bacterium]